MTEIDKSRIKKNKAIFFLSFLSPEIEYDNFGLLQFRTVNVSIANVFKLESTTCELYIVNVDLNQNPEFPLC